jgi:hypothetical protein
MRSVKIHENWVCGYTKIQTENEREDGILVPEGFDFFGFEERNLKCIEREVEEDRDMPKIEREKEK